MQTASKQLCASALAAIVGSLCRAFGVADLRDQRRLDQPNDGP